MVIIKQATVSQIFAEGVTLIFDGESVASLKKYKVLRTYVPQINDRVLCVKISGTYVVLGNI